MGSLADAFDSSAYRGAAGVTGVAQNPGAPRAASAPFDSSAYAGAAGVTGVVGATVNDPYNARVTGNGTMTVSLFDERGPRSSRPEDVDAYARDNYGYLAGFLDHPEIGGILRDAAINRWSPGKLYGAVSATDWWKNTSAAQRTWQQLKNEDPAEARRLVAQTAATVTNRAQSLGLGLSAGAIGSIAHQATVNGWTDAQVVDRLVNQINWATIEAGDLTAKRDEVKAIGSDYLVGVSDTTAQNYAARIASGEMTEEGVRSAMQQQARARFGWMASELDQGITVKDYLAPVADTIARELGVTGAEIDLMDSKWLKMVETRGEDGKMRAATLDEAMLAARRQPEFNNTQKAKEMTGSLSGAISKMFGGA